MSGLSNRVNLGVIPGNEAVLVNVLLFFSSKGTGERCLSFEVVLGLNNELLNCLSTVVRSMTTPIYVLQLHSKGQSHLILPSLVTEV